MSPYDYTPRDPHEPHEGPGAILDTRPHRTTHEERTRERQRRSRARARAEASARRTAESYAAAQRYDCPSRPDA